MKKDTKISIAYVISSLVFSAGFFVLATGDTKTFIAIMLIMIGRDMKDDVLKMRKK